MGDGDVIFGSGIFILPFWWSFLYIFPNYFARIEKSFQNVTLFLLIFWPTSTIASKKIFIVENFEKATYGRLVLRMVH